MRQIFAKIWKDPVGSKVIAAGIGYVLSNIYTFLQSKYQGVDFKEVIQAQALYFNLSDWWYYILLSSGFIIVSISGIWLLKKIIVRCVTRKKSLVYHQHQLRIFYQLLRLILLYYLQKELPEHFLVKGVLSGIILK